MNYIIESMDEQFEINAFTATLAETKKANSLHILNNGTWQIPIYQRPYSWNDEQILRFMRDLKDGFLGENGNSVPIFIGTMQFSESKGEYREVIDGQQRLTTFLLLIDVLNEQNKENNIDTNWLLTKVNQGESQKDLDQVIKFKGSDLTENSTTNRYVKNRLIIKNFLEDENADTHQNEDFDLLKFTKYILTQVYFVCIETKATLSKTLQIFESINATGMDLNSGDLFKVNFYEYLTAKKGESQSIFGEISKLYADIDRANKNPETGYVTNINEILNIYKYILISKYDLQSSLYFMGVSTFYERLFDVILNNTPSQGFPLEKSSLVSLSISELDAIIKLRIDWNNSLGKTAEEDLAHYFVSHWSRYTRYWIGIIIFKFVYKDKIDADFQNKFMIQFHKLLWIYSVCYKKATIECHRAVREIFKVMFTTEKPDDIIALINLKLQKHNVPKNQYSRLRQKLTSPITDNNKLKNLVCRLSALLDDENYLSEDRKVIEKMRKNYFVDKIDIEHIQSYNDFEKTKRNEIWQKWGPEINSLGNLVILESEINKSISNKPFETKRERYLKSNYSSVQEISKLNKSWTLREAKTRKAQEIDKILTYLFS